jgi:hypothetical protein
MNIFIIFFVLFYVSKTDKSSSSYVETALLVLVLKLACIYVKNVGVKGMHAFDHFDL